MKQTARIISTYAADVSGVASALFELGGMTVIHDASGCNSTYNTHDEPRWYDFDSQVFISALTEIDAIMGNDEKLVDDICDAAGDLHPRFVAIAGTPIPMMIGTDLTAIARRVEAKTGIPAFALKTNSMHSYVSGVSMAFEALAQRFCDRSLSREKGSGKVNILGVTPLDYSVNGSDADMRRWLGENGFETVSLWAMGSTLDEISRSGCADVNLVTSWDGMAAAGFLQKTFGTPYVVGAPLGRGFSRVLASALIKASETGESEIPCAMSTATEKRAVIIGEGVYSASLAQSIEIEYGVGCRVVCPTEIDAGILPAGSAAALDEDEIIPLLPQNGIIIADPLYKPVCPENSRFFSLPSEAFSGRIYRKDIPNLINKALETGGELK